MNKKVQSESTKYNLVVFLGSLLLFTYGSTWRGPLMYTHYITGAFVVGINMVAILYKKTINKKNMNILIIQTTFILLNIIISQKVADFNRHLNVFIQTVLTIIFANAFVNLLYQNKLKIELVFLELLSLWNILTFIMIITKMFNPYSETGRLIGIFNNPNIFAINTLYLLLIPIVSFKKYTSYNKKKIIINVILSLFLIIQTASFKGVLGLTVIFGSIIMFGQTKKRYKAIFLTVIILTSLIYITVFSNSEMMNRILMYLDFYRNKGSVSIWNSASIRRSLMEQSYGVISKNFWSGVGIDNSRFYIYQPQHGPASGTYSHNNYLEILLNGGFIVFIAYYMPIIRLLIQNFLKRYKNSSCLIIVTIILVKLVLDTGFVSYNNFTSILMITIAFYEHDYKEVQIE